MQLFFVLVSAYPMFWLQSFDHGRRMRVYRTSDLGTSSALVSDEPPSLFSVTAAFWALCVAALAAISDRNCSVSSNDVFEPEVLVGVLAIAACGKCLFGAFAEHHKRVVLTEGGVLARPVTWRLLDAVTALPVSLVSSLGNKLFWFSIFSGLVWILGVFGVNTGSDALIVPDYVILPCALLYFGRVAAIHVHKDVVPLQAAIGVPHRKPWTGAMRGGIVLWSVASFLITYGVLEGVLKHCGAVPNQLPSIGALLVGLLSTPLLTIGSALVGAGVGVMLAAGSE